jgi:hypothetical protein
MRDNITTIRSPLIDNFTRIIQSLAKRGRNVYHEYLVDPLSQWSDTVPVEPIDRLVSLLEQARKSGSKKIPLLYKMSLVKSVAPDQFDLAIPGNLSLGFLKSMKEEPRITSSDEALEFVNLLKNGFKTYSDREFIRMNRKFEQEIAEVSEVEVEKLIKAHEGEEEKNRQIDEQSGAALEEIRSTVGRGSLPDIKRAIIVYLLKFSDPLMPNRHYAVDGTIDRMEHRHASFRKELMDSTAVIIYHEILKAITDNRLEDAVKYIGKYAVLFRGNPDTPNYREVDSFEKKFFQIIEERNLWDRLR